MLTQRKRPLAMGISWVAVIGLMLAGFFVIGCGRPSADSTAAASSPPPATNISVTGVVLRADPNPVPGGTETGKTTITWQTGSEAAADIYMVNGTEETLFATGPRGAKEASIRPGSNEFRFYNQGQHKLVTSLIVTMPASAASATSATSAPATSAASPSQ